MFSSFSNSIIAKTVRIGGITIVSRLLGIVREIMIARYLGTGMVSDAFITALKVPNFLRKIFAEGALSAAFIPSFIAALKKDKAYAQSLLSLAFILFEGMLLIFCLFTMIKAPYFIGLISGGFTQAQIDLTVPLLRILLPFIFFISSSALLAGALQSIDKFFVPAVGSIELNIVFIMGLVICGWYGLPVQVVCIFVVAGACVQFLHHLYAFFKHGFAFGAVNKATFAGFGHILVKFLLCSISMSTGQLSLFIDTSFASYLAPGTITLLSYANKFMHIPLGVFGVAFSTILLPHFSRLSMYAPKRINFYLLESAKMMWWITLPSTLALIFFADSIFITLFSSSLSADQVRVAGAMLQAFTVGLFFFSLNKVLLSIFYALHATVIPTLVSLCATGVNILINILFLRTFGGIGLAWATTLAGVLQTVLLLFFLRSRYAIHGHLGRFFVFAARYCIQVLAISSLFLGTYYGISFLLHQYAPTAITTIFISTIGLWIWVGPLWIGAMAILYYSRNWFKVSVYFLER